MHFGQGADQGVVNMEVNNISGEGQGDSDVDRVSNPYELPCRLEL